MLELLTSPEAWTALVTLSVLEIVLGVDNLVMIAILVNALPAEKQSVARKMGIGFALLTRICLLFTISWLAGLVEPVFHLGAHPFSVRDFVMLAGGAFLIIKGAKELVEMRHPEHIRDAKALKGGVFIVILQIGFFDIVFSLDSVITAVGMSNQLPVMVTAICIAMVVMLFLSGPIVNILNNYMSIKVLALCFLIIVGIMLVESGFNINMPKSYLYAAMAFSAFVEIMVIWINKSRAKRTSA